MVKKNKSCQGFTLVEIIVSLGILVAFIALTCAILLSVFGHFGRNAAMTQGKEIGDTVAQCLDDQLRYATELEITDDPQVSSYNTAYQVKDGNLFYWKTDDSTQTKNYYGQDFYHGMTVETTVQVKNGRWLTLTVVVYKSDGSKVYTTENTYEIINMALAEKESALDINGTADENTLKVTVGGGLDPDGEWADPIFCFSSDVVVQREDYLPPPTAMYDQCIETLALMRETPGLNVEYDGVGQVNNEGVRNYVRINYYDNNWPDASAYLDIDAIAMPTGNYIKPLNQRNIVIQPHIAVNTDAVVIFGRDYGTGDPNANQWNNCVLVFVPNNYSADSVDMSSGKWYTYLPTVDHPQWHNYWQLDGLTDTSKDIVEFYDTVKKNWHPIDGQGCICDYCHPGGE
ncbi:MAG: type II secretion system protein [Bacillota bacterium]|nr:type II secretion system protein [Bacillota bacterium]